MESNTINMNRIWTSPAELRAYTKGEDFRDLRCAVADSESGINLYFTENENSIILWGYETKESSQLKKSLLRLKVNFKIIKVVDQEDLNQFFLYTWKELSEARQKKNQNAESAEEELRNKIKYWLNTNPYQSFKESIKARVIGQENVSKITAAVYNYMECIAENKPNEVRIMLSAPSGSGKTETYRAIRDYFNQAIPEFPVYQTDASILTQSGFRGKNIEEMLLPMFERRALNGIGIMFLDELDKKMVPSYEAGGGNVNRMVQNEMLTILEGTTLTTKFPNGETVSVNTANTLFIGLGAFSCAREKKKERKVGFETKTESWYSEISRQDVLDFGASEQLIGRFSVFVSYHELNNETCLKVIDAVKSKVENSMGVKITLGKKMKEQLLENANSGFGCRLFEAMIRENAITEYEKILDAGMSSKDITIKIAEDGVTSFTTKRKQAKEQVIPLENAC